MIKGSGALTATGIKKLAYLPSYLQYFTCRTRYLFIFSHMRSRSSVLCHILGSNPGICGYSELQLSYLNRMSLINMRRLLQEDLGGNLRNKYLLDKILNDYLIFSDNVLKITKPRAIFLLRKPESTIQSIIHMGDLTGIEWYKDPVNAANYYCSRLSSLEELAGKFAGNYFFIEADDLLDHADCILDRLTGWLGLPVPLSKSYSTFSHTGKPGYGDPSPNLKSGTLKRTEDHPDIRIPPDILQRSESAYVKCMDILCGTMNRR